MMKMSTRRTLALAGSAVALTLVLSGCSMINSVLGGGPADADRDDDTGQVTESASIDIFALKVGDCKMASDSGLIQSADVVPCEEPHDEEVYFEITMDDGEFSEEAVDTATQGCIGDAFSNFIGVIWDESTLDVYPITPTQETWDQYNDRIVQCVVTDPAGPVTGSLAGAAR